MIERLGIITDEVSNDFVEALDWVREQRLKHVEIRTVNGRNIMNLSDDEIERIRTAVEQNGLFVSGVASPIFKCALDPSRAVASGDTHGQSEDHVAAHFGKLTRAMRISKILGTSNIRIFSFWRELDPAQYEDEIVSHLKKAAVMAESENVLLLLENEPSCNGGFATEVGRMVRRVNSSALKVLWDPGNEEYGGSRSYPDGYEMVKGIVRHVHLKDAYVDAEGLAHCVPIGAGNVPLIRQLQALNRDGYSGLFTIETHYIPRGGKAIDGSNITLDALRALLKNAEMEFPHATP